MYHITFDTKGFNEVIAASRRLAAIISPQTVETLGTTLTERALAITKKETPGKGRVRSLWEVRKVVQAGYYEGTIRNQLEATDVGRLLLEVLEGGSHPHEIRPGTSRVLRFVVNNKEIFTRLVHHPGTRPYNMVLKAYIDILQTAVAMQEGTEKHLLEVFDGRQK